MNKTFLSFLVSLAIASTALAAETPVRSCLVSEAPANPSSKMKIDLYADHAVYSSASQSGGASTQEKLSKVEGAVRANLNQVAKAMAKEMMNPSSTTDSTQGLNPAELYLASAMVLPLIGLSQVFHPGFDLSKVRSATVYLLGEASNMGQAGVVVGFDSHGKELGSFLGGMVVNACE